MRKSRFLSRIVISALVAATFATAAEAAPQGCAPPGAWATRTPYTNTISRAWGAFYPPDGKFYLMGGRPDDVAGDDFIQVHIYDPVADSWAESNATFTDNQNNNMVGGVLDFGGGQILIEHALISPQIHVRLHAVVEDEDFAVAVGVEGS